MCTGIADTDSKEETEDLVNPPFSEESDTYLEWSHKFSPDKAVCPRWRRTKGAKTKQLLPKLLEIYSLLIYFCCICKLFYQLLHNRQTKICSKMPKQGTNQIFLSPSKYI
jgi:hypothetical protein